MAHQQLDSQRLYPFTSHLAWLMRKPMADRSDMVILLVAQHYNFDARLDRGSHALITTQWYRSAGRQARQRVSLQIAMGALLEWLPQEIIVFDTAQANSHVDILLDTGRGGATGASSASAGRRTRSTSPLANGGSTCRFRAAANSCLSNRRVSKAAAASPLHRSVWQARRRWQIYSPRWIRLMPTA